ncbi:MAG TPA: hypothetical protein VF173_13870 [Thermoanaerobaculia bacterium]|nr:hypothetical protein [Thermoanaerobaculia bacterium]
MKKLKMKKLSLNRETLHALESPDLRVAQGAAIISPITVPVPASRRFPCTNELSVCITCTQPIDTCPGNPTIAVA